MQKPAFLLERVQRDNGARPSGRFNVRIGVAREILGLIGFREMKRRERRAPCHARPRHSMARAVIIAAVASSALLLPKAGAAEALKPDADGYIRHWVMLAPVAIPEGETCAEALLKELIPNEGALRPKAGDKVKVNGKELSWRNITAATNYFDINETLKSINDHVAGYMVTYIECDQDMPGVIIAVASNDQGRLYFNGVDIYAFTEARPLMLDADKGRITLKKGVNTFVFKVTNEQNAWQGAMRFLDKAGAPVKGLKIKLTP